MHKAPWAIADLECLFPLEARRAARLDVGKSTSTVRVPQRGTLCVPRQVELRSRHIEAGSTGSPRDNGARHQGRPSFGYLSWPRKKGNQPPGCPRPPLQPYAMWVDYSRSQFKQLLG